MFFNFQTNPWLSFLEMLSAGSPQTEVKPLTQKVKTLILDSPKGDYTPRTGQVLPNVQHLAIPALSVGCSLPSGNPKSGFWLFVSMDSPLFEVIQLTEFPGNSLMDSSKNWKTSEMSVMETHFLWFGCTPGVNFLEILSAGSPLTEVNQLTEFPGNSAMDSK